jgi:DNA-binding beta-propeller fold protein YncE
MAGYIQGIGIFRHTHDSKSLFSARVLKSGWFQHIVTRGPQLDISVSDEQCRYRRRIDDDEDSKGRQGNCHLAGVTAHTEGRRLFVPHGTEVVVLDLDSGAVVGKMAGQKGVHGVAIAREFGHGFISATDPGSVTMFDLKTLAVLDKAIGDDPNGIIYDPKTQRVFSADRGNKRLTAIDAKTGKVVGMVDDLGGRTEHVYLNMQDVGKLHKIDAQNLKVTETWTLAPPCGQPSSMDMDRAHNRIFVGCRGGGQAPSLLAVVDATNGKIVATQPIGMGVDALEFDSKTG